MDIRGVEKSKFEINLVFYGMNIGNILFKFNVIILTLNFFIPMYDKNDNTCTQYKTQWLWQNNTESYLCQKIMK